MLIDPTKTDAKHLIAAAVFWTGAQYNLLRNQNASPEVSELATQLRIAWEMERGQTTLVFAENLNTLPRNDVMGTLGTAELDSLGSPELSLEECNSFLTRWWLDNLTESTNNANMRHCLWRVKSVLETNPQAINNELKFEQQRQLIELLIKHAHTLAIQLEDLR